MAFPENPPPPTEIFAYEEPAYANKGPLHEPPEGFPYTSESPIRRYTEPALFLLYPYAAGLTVMDDHIAAGVKYHSEFIGHPWGRLAGTANAAITLAFGNQEESLAKAQAIYEFHKTVRGRHGDTTYDANDMERQVWVLGSVFDAYERVWQREWAPEPSLPERQGLYKDFLTFSEMFGMDPDLMPPDLAAFKDYWEGMLNGGKLLQTEASREMTQAVFRAQSPKIPAPVRAIAQAIAVTSLDPRLQEQANLMPTDRDYRLVGVVDHIMRNTHARTPKGIREKAIPLYLSAQQHLGPSLGRLALTARHIVEAVPLRYLSKKRVKS